MRISPRALQGGWVVPHVDNKEKAADLFDAAFEHVHIHVKNVTTSRCSNAAVTHHDGGLLACPGNPAC